MFKHKFRRSNHPRKAGRSIPSRLQVGANDEGAQMSGYLQQQKVGAGAGSSSKWKKFWFVLKDRVLYEYRASEDKVAAQTYPILGFDLDVDVEVGNTGVIKSSNICVASYIWGKTKEIGEMRHRQKVLTRCCEMKHFHVGAVVECVKTSSQPRFSI